MTDPHSDSRAHLRTTHGYFGEAHRVFGSYHRPSTPASNVGYVLCPPLGYEGVHCYHALRLLAEDLASAGCSILRVDYDGTGEALGDYGDPARVAAWRRSVIEAIAVLSELEHVESVGLVGLRMGATLAMLASAETDVDEIVLWEPCVSGALYARELEIVASASGQNAPDDPPGLQAGGYLFTPETLDDLIPDLRDSEDRYPARG